MGFKSLWQIIKETENYSNTTNSQIAFAVVIIPLLLIPIACIVLGIVFIDQCPAEGLIPIFLIIFGLYICLHCGVYYLCLFCERYIIKSVIKSSTEDEPPKSTSENSQSANNKSCTWKCALYIVDILFLPGWWVAGSVWVFRIYPPEYENEESEIFCDKILYLFSFVFLVVIYSILGLILLGSWCYEVLTGKKLS